MADGSMRVCGLCTRCAQLPVCTCRVNTQQMVAWFINRHSARLAHQISDSYNSYNSFPFPEYISFGCKLYKSKCDTLVRITPQRAVHSTEPKSAHFAIFIDFIGTIFAQRVNNSAPDFDAKLCRRCMLHHLQQMVIPLS